MPQEIPKTISRIKEEGKLRKEIDDFIQTNSTRYENALKTIREFFLWYQRSSRGRWILYRVESRGDNQSGNELKEVSSILEKMQRKRSKKPNYSVFDMEDIIGLRLICSYVSDLNEVVRYILEEQDELMIHEIQFHGLRDQFEEFKRLWKFDELRREVFSKDDQLKILDKIFPEPRYESRADGYRAVHITVSLNKPVELQDVKCEVQVGTSILRALADKTHGLIYKEREVEKPYMTIVSNISDGLFADDLQTEIAREEIVKKRIEETTRRRGVYIEHIRRISIERIKTGAISVSEDMRALSEKIEKYIKGKETLEQIKDVIEGRISSFLGGNIKYDKLIRDKFGDNVKDEFGKPVNEKEFGIKNIKNYVKDKKKLQLNLDNLIRRLIELETFMTQGDTNEHENNNVFHKNQLEIFPEYRILCQMTSALAMSDDFGRFDDQAINYVNKLINIAFDKNQVAKAHGTKALLLYGLGRFKEAYEAIRTVIWDGERDLQDKLLAELKNSCAYYAAERIDELSRLGKLYPNEEDEKKELEDEAYLFISKALEILNSLYENITNEIQRTGDNQKQKVVAEKKEIDFLKIYYPDTKVFIDLVCSSSAEDIAKSLTEAKQIYDKICSNDKFSKQEKTLVRQYYAKNIRKASQRLAQILKL
jgi:ppGpp synthetase/RelA/SpoT-type nucleotidyltranferase